MFVAWAGIALASETGTALGWWDFRQGNDLPSRWRLGMAPVDRLRQCLDGVAADGRVPRDSVVLLASPAGDRDPVFFRSRWAAYLLPRLQVVAPGDPRADAVASFLIAYHVEPAPPPGASLELVRQLAGGRLYRVRRP
jgi:hypothetical protein